MTVRTQPSLRAPATWQWSSAVVAAGILAGAVWQASAWLALLLATCAVATIWIVALNVTPPFILIPLPLAILLPPVHVFAFDGRSIGLTVADLIIVAASVAWLARPTRFERAWLNGHLTLIAWTAVSVLASVNLGLSLVGFKVVVESSLVALMASTCTNAYRSAALLRAVVISAGLMSLVATAQLARQGAFGLLGQGTRDGLSAQIEELHNSATTLTLAFGRSNYAGAIIFLGVLAVIAYWNRISAGRVRVLAVLTICCGTLGILATASRSQLIALAAVLVLAIAIKLTRRRAVDPRGSEERGDRLGVGSLTLLALAIGAGVALTWGYVSAVFTPVAQEGILTFSSVQTRVDLWGAAIHTTWEHPLVGVGVFALALPSATGVFPTAHDVFLQVSAETGIPGLMIYIWVLAIPVWRARKDVRRIAGVLTVGLLFAGLAEPTLRTGPYDFVAWLLLGAAVGVVANSPDRQKIPTAREVSKANIHRSRLNNSPSARKHGDPGS